MNQYKTIIRAVSVFSIFIALIVAPPFVEAQPGVLSATPTTIPVSKPTDVTVTIQLTDSRLISNSVNLQRFDASGKVIAVLGNLNDSGINGDTVAGDKIFSLRHTFTETTIAPVQLRVSWALKGEIRRALSNTVAIEISPNFSANGVALEVPQGWTLDQKSLDLKGPISLNNFAGAYKQGGLRPPGGAEIDITNVPLPTLTLQEVINRDLKGTTIESTTQLVVAGQTATKVVYSFDMLTGGVEKNIAVYVPHGNLLYKFFLSYTDGDPKAQQFLHALDDLLARVSFT